MFATAGSVQRKAEKLRSVDRPGLINPSNTCYLNSSLQCLATLESVHTLLGDADPSSSHARAPFSSPSLQALLHEKYPADLPVTAALAAVLRKMWSQKNGTVNAKELLKSIGKKNELYADINEQQDVQEAFSYLTACLWEEEMDLIKKARPAPAKEEKPQKKRRRRRTIGTRDTQAATDSSEGGSSSSSDSSSDSSISDRELPTPTPEASPDPSSEPVLRPFVDTLFGGKLASIIVCEECKHVSIAREPFQDLSVEMEKDEKPRRRDRIRQFLSKNAEPPSSIDKTPADKRPAIIARQSSTFGSVSEAEASASEEEGTGTMKKHTTSDLSRRRSLDPGILRARKSIFSSKSRDPSPQRKISKHHSSTQGPAIPRVSPEQAAYIKRLLADIPGAALTPLPNIRVAQPDGKAKVISPGSDYGSPNGKKKEKDSHHFALPLPHHHKHELSDAKVLEEQMSTGLYEALRRFTAVEILEGENAFQCRNCWKLLHPKLAHTGRRRRRSTIKQGDKAYSKDSDADDDEDELEARTRPLLHSNNVTLVNGDLAPVSNTLSMMSTISRVESSSSDSSIYSIKPRTVPSISTSLVGDEPARLGPISSAESSSGEERSTAPTSEETTAVIRQASIASSVMSAASAPTVLQQDLSQLSLILPPGKTPPKASLPPKAQRYVLRRAHKRLLIDALPRALVIHLKRFQQSSRTAMFGSGFRDLKKIDTFVSFPLELDLAPFLAPKGKPPSSTKAGGRPALIPTLSGGHHSWFHWHHHSSDKSKPLSTRYKLVGVINHAGSMQSGHYTASVLALNRHGERQWISASDETVRAISEAELRQVKAYNLWYERID